MQLNQNKMYQNDTKCINRLTLCNNMCYYLVADESLKCLLLPDMQLKKGRVQMRGTAKTVPLIFGDVQNDGKTFLFFE